LAAALRLRAAGATRDQIAAALDIAPEAVDTQLQLAGRKLARRRRDRASGRQREAPPGE
jgi:DNA-binding CsgD family transcriptional regulator